MNGAKDRTTQINRRWFALGAAGALALVANEAVAQSQKNDHAAHAAAAKKPAPKKAEMPAKYKPVVQAAKLCETRGQTCRTHCIRQIRKGDLSLQECLRLVEVTLPICAATAKLATQDARRFRDLAKVCLDVCVDCEAECKKHAAHHAECKGCMEACQAMITALKPLLAA